MSSGQFFSRSDIVKTAERRKERKELIEKRKQQISSRVHRDSEGSPPPERNDLDAVAALTPPVVTCSESPLATASATTAASAIATSSSTPIKTPRSSASKSRSKAATSTATAASTLAVPTTVASSSTSTTSTTSKTGASKSSLSRGASQVKSSTRRSSDVGKVSTTTSETATSVSSAVTTSLSAPLATADAESSSVVPQDYAYWAPVDSEHVTPTVAFSWSSIFTSMPGLSTSTSPSPPPSASSPSHLLLPGESSSSTISTADEDSALGDRINKFGPRASRSLRVGVARSNSTPTSASETQPPSTSGAALPSSPLTLEASPHEPPPASAEDEPVSASVLDRVSNTFGPAAKRKDVSKFARTVSAPLGVSDVAAAAAAASSTPEAASSTSIEEPELEVPIQAAVLSRVSDKFGPAAKRKDLFNLGVVRSPSEDESNPTTSKEGRSISIQTSIDESVEGAEAGGEAGAAAAARVDEDDGTAAAEQLVGKSVAPYLRYFKKKKLSKSAQEAATPSPPPGTTPEPRLTPPVTTPEATTPPPPPTPEPSTNSGNNNSNTSNTNANNATTSATTPTTTSFMSSTAAEAAINRSRKSVCPNEKCKALNSYLSFKCIACQTKLGQLITCKGCGTTVNELAGHCGKCGAGVATRSEIANAPVLDPKTQDAGAGVNKCPQPGCKTITHPSWKYCCTCGKSLKPHGPETMGPPAHLKNLGLESEDSADKLEADDESPPPAPEELINASINGSTRKVVDLLLRGVPVNQLDEHGISSLNYACWNDRFNVVRVLTAFDADLNLRESRGYTALHAACDRSKSEALMEFLVKHGADLNGRGDMGESILHHAAAGGNLDGINFAVRHGIDVNDPDVEGATPLAYAALCDEISPLEYLLSNGADINAKRLNGQTILHRAVQYRKTACLEFAVDKGLKVCDRDDEGHSALDIAYSTRAPQKIINFLRDAFRNELERCSFCEDAPAHIQFHPCHHQYACADCCTRWKKCKCGKAIEKKVDVILDTKGESGKVQEDDAKKFAVELAALQLEKERFNEEKTCAVCLDRPKAIVFDCGHTTCAECSVKMRLCHSCRKPIAKKIKFY